MKERGARVAEVRRDVSNAACLEPSGRDNLVQGTPWAVSSPTNPGDWLTIGV
jgi:hypothetical protein